MRYAELKLTALDAQGHDMVTTEGGVDEGGGVLARWRRRKANDYVCSKCHEPARKLEVIYPCKGPSDD